MSCEGRGGRSEIITVMLPLMTLFSTVSYLARALFFDFRACTDALSPRRAENKSGKIII